MQSEGLVIKSKPSNGNTPYMNLSFSSLHKNTTRYQTQKSGQKPNLVINQEHFISPTVAPPSIIE